MNVNFEEFDGSWYSCMQDMVKRMNSEVKQSLKCFLDIKKDEVAIVDTNVFYHSEVIFQLFSCSFEKILVIDNSEREIRQKIKKATSFEEQMEARQALLNFYRVADYEKTEIVKSTNPVEICDITIFRCVNEHLNNSSLPRAVVISADEGLIELIVLEREGNIQNLRLVLNKRNSDLYKNQVRTIWIRSNIDGIQYWENKHNQI